MRKLAVGPTRRSMLLTALSLLICTQAPSSSRYRGSSHETPTKTRPAQPQCPRRALSICLSHWPMAVRRQVKSPTQSGRPFTEPGWVTTSSTAMPSQTNTGCLAQSGEPIVLGMNFRVYTLPGSFGTSKWLNALDGTWTDLTSEQFGGARFAASPSPMPLSQSVAPQWPFTRATYTNISKSHFTWRGEKSDGRENLDRIQWSWSAIAPGSKSRADAPAPEGRQIIAQDEVLGKPGIKEPSPVRGGRKRYASPFMEVAKLI